MEKLSRKDKYRALRESLDNPNEKAQTPEPAVKTVRKAAPDVKAESRKMPGVAGNPVIEDLLGEVTQYNLDNGEIVSEDTQLQILHDLSEESEASQRRSSHFEPMEVNEDAGGTTRNIYGSDFSEILYKPESTASKPFTLDVDESDTAQETIEPDYLDLFTPATIEPENEAAAPSSKPSARSERAGKIEKAKAKAENGAAIKDEEPEEKPAKKSANKKRSKSKAKPAAKPAKAAKPVISAEEDEHEEKGSKAATIFMTVCSIILVILIILTIYWMYKLGIF